MNTALNEEGFYTCDSCGQTVMNETDLTKTYEDGYLCKDCIGYYEQCPDCGEYHLMDNLRTVANGTRVCETCIDELYFYCEHCEEYHSKDDEIYLGIYDRYVCDRCLSCYYYKCEDCGEYVRQTESITTHSGDIICGGCFENNYRSCDCCGDVYHYRDICGDCDRCPDCCDCNSSNSEDIHNYSYKPKPVFYSESGVFNTITNKHLYMGVEFETEIKRDLYETAYNLSSLLEGKAYLKTDGSLDDGFEIVTHPCTLGYHEKNFKWKGVLEELEDVGFNLGTCGIHVHVNRQFFSKQDEIKLGHFVAVFEKKLVRIAQRKSNGYAAYKKAIKGQLKGYLTDFARYKALNFTNKSTLEFRIFKTVFELNTIHAFLEFVDALSHFIKTVSIAEIVFNPVNVWKKFEEYTNKGKKYKNFLKYCKEIDLDSVVVENPVITF